MRENSASAPRPAEAEKIEGAKRLFRRTGILVDRVSTVTQDRFVQQAREQGKNSWSPLVALRLRVANRKRPEWGCFMPATASVCHVCGAEAVDRCYTCGRLFCALHGRTNCCRCDAAIAPGDTRPDRVSASRLREASDGHAWWRPQQAEDVELPACHLCGGLSRTVCRNCGRYYCADHAGPAGLCRDCNRSSMFGLICMAGALAVMLGLILLGYLVGLR